MTKQKKISDVIKQLKDLKDAYGDLPCVYATDEEGNSFSPVYNDASEGEFDGGDFDPQSNNINAVCIN